MTGLHQQENGYWYAWCSCGVVGSLRRNRRDARSDRRAHATVCSNGGKR